MVAFDFIQKDEFTEATQVHNLGRLLTRSSREAYDCIREAMLAATQASNALPASLIEGDNTRVNLWERVRTLREVFLKLLVVLQLKDTLPSINQAIQIGASIWDAREAVRRRAQEFYEIQWPPLGGFPPPAPPPAIQASVDLLTLKKSTAMPIYTQLSVEQTNSNPLDCVNHLKLPGTFFLASPVTIQTSREGAK